MYKPNTAAAAEPIQENRTTIADSCGVESQPPRNSIGGALATPRPVEVENEADKAGVKWPHYPVNLWDTAERILKSASLYA